MAEGAPDGDFSGLAEQRLAREDPRLRRQRGVYATPRPLVAFVVRAVHEFLQERFEKPAGLAEPEVRLFDPSAGPMNFLLEAWREALAEGGQRGLNLHLLLRDHLLPHSLGIELLELPYRLGHLAVRGFLERHLFRLTPGLRLPLVLGDALADSTRPAPPEGGLPVILGNPPYAGRTSANRGAWISALLHGYRLPDGRSNDGYFSVDGQPLGERNSRWLQDDAVKFLRYAEWCVDRAGHGLVALVLNHNFIDAPTFRGLRASLLATFDQIYALDLHGNQRKRIGQSDPQPDGNVFRIAQGVAVLFLLKRPGLQKQVLRADLRGTREEKLVALASAKPSTIEWAELRPRAPSYLFIVTDSTRERQFRREMSLVDMFSVSTTGIITGRDALLTAIDRHSLEDRLTGPVAPGAEGELHLSEEDWRILRRDTEWQRRIAPILVRPFDVRQVIYADRLLARPRSALMEHMLSGDNLGLVVARQCQGDPGALVTAWLVGHKAVSAYDVNTFFPLYLQHPQTSGYWPWYSNVQAGLISRLSDAYGQNVTPLAVFHYLYAVLYCPPYRARYRPFLQRDFPRIPFPREVVSFTRLSSLGHELVGLHLSRDERLLRPTVGVFGNSREPLGKRRAAICAYRDSEARVYLAEHAFGFDGLRPEVWHYRIGGHQVLERWLRARGGHILRHGDIAHFRWAAEALRLTLALDQSLAAAYQAVEEGGSMHG